MLLNDKSKFNFSSLKHYFKESIIGYVPSAVRLFPLSHNVNSTKLSSNFKHSPNDIPPSEFILLLEMLMES